MTGGIPQERALAVRPDAPARLVRLGGHWWCRHELAAVIAPDSASA